MSTTEDIRTEFVYRPCPTRIFDWYAWIDGREDGIRGNGPTEQDAIDDLLNQLES